MLIPGGQQVACERFPKDKFGLGLFFAGFATFAVTFGIGGSCFFPGVGKKNEAGSSYQDQKEKPDIGSGSHN